MRYIGFLLILFSFAFKANAQIEIMASKHLVSKSDLYAISLINNGTTAQQITIGFTLQNNLGISMLDQRSSTLNLAPGSRNFNRSSLGYLTGTDNIQEDKLAAGDYQLKVTIYSLNSQILGSSLFPFVVMGYTFTDTSSQAKSGFRKHVKFNGFGSITGQLAGQQGYLSDIPANYIRADLHPTVALGSLPFGLDVLYSTESSSQRQPMNQVNFRFDPVAYANSLMQNALDKVKDIQEVGSMQDLQKLEDLKGGLKKEPLKQLEGIKGKQGEDKLENYENKLKESENLANTLKSDIFTKGLAELNNIKKKYAVENEAQFEAKKDKLPQETYTKAKRLFALEKQYKELKEKKVALDKWKKINEKGIAAKQKLDEIDKGNLAASLMDPANLKSSLKALGDLGKVEKIMGGVQTFSIGTSYPYFSELTFNGARVNGINIELNPGKFYVNLCKGTSATDVYNSNDASNYALKQKVDALKIGVGKKETSHLYFTGIQFKDDNKTVFDTVFQEVKTPTRNYVLGTDVQVSFMKKTIIVGGEANVSVNNRDQNASEGVLPIDRSVNEVIPGFITSKLNASSYGSYAYKVFSRVELFKNKTSINGSLTQIAPGYFTYANPTIIDDLRKVEMKVKQSLFKSKLSVNAFYNENKNSLIPSVSVNVSTFNNYGLGVRYQATKYYAMLNFSPYYQENEDLFNKVKFKNRSQMVNALVGVNLRIRKVGFSSTQLGFIRQSTKSNVVGYVYSSNIITLNQNVTIKKFGANMNMSLAPNQKIYTESATVAALDVSGFVTIRKKVRTSFGLQSFSTQKINNRSGAYLKVNYPVTKWINFDLKVLNMEYTDTLIPTNNFKSTFANFGLLMNW